MPITDSINSFIGQMEESMKERLAKLSKEYSTLRTGRANPFMLDEVKVDYYGQSVPLKQVAAVSIPEARILEIRPWDPSALADIDKAIQKSDLGIPPQNDGKAIRLIMPSMTEERRKDLVKVVKRIAEDFRVTIRNDRHAAMEKIKKAEKAKEITQDEVRGIETKVQKITDAYIGEIDREAARKEKEVTTV
ncbi:MAG: ribosome recycling factor [Elusimicrobiota bacterium]